MQRLWSAHDAIRRSYRQDLEGYWGSDEETRAKARDEDDAIFIFRTSQLKRKWEELNEFGKYSLGAAMEGLESAYMFREDCISKYYLANETKA
eukprot:1100062-Karenia_brevis.AAC.1